MWRRKGETQFFPPRWICVCVCVLILLSHLDGLSRHYLVSRYNFTSAQHRFNSVFVSLYLFIMCRNQEEATQLKLAISLRECKAIRTSLFCFSRFYRDWTFMSWTIHRSFLGIIHNCSAFAYDNYTTFSIEMWILSERSEQSKFSCLKLNFLPFRFFRYPFLSSSTIIENRESFCDRLSTYTLCSRLDENRARSSNTMPDDLPMLMYLLPPLKLPFTSYSGAYETIHRWKICFSLRLPALGFYCFYSK